MQINTNLTKHDYVNAYKSMLVFCAKNPLALSLVVGLCVGVSLIPFAAFPLKMATYALAICLSVSIITTQYRTGSLVGLGQELRFQQRLITAVSLATLVLSWAGYAAAGFIIDALPGNAVGLAGQWDATAVGGLIMAASALCVMQIMPLVLMFFCHGLQLSRQQGEQIWYKLAFSHSAFLAFVPLAQLIPLGVLAGFDTSALFLIGAALYATFVFFIVFNIQPSAPQRQRTFTLAGQC